MKKLLFLLAAVAAISFAGCDKGGGEGEPKLDDRLVGTKWQTRDTVYELFYGGTAYNVYEFLSTTEVEDYVVKNGNVVDSHGIHTYELNYPTLTIHTDSDTTPKLVFEFKDTRTIVRVGQSESSPYMKYVKQ